MVGLLKDEKVIERFSKVIRTRANVSQLEVKKENRPPENGK